MSHQPLPHADLIAEVEAFCAETGASKSGVGAAALNDPCFLSDLERGRECLPRTVAKVRRHMADARAARSEAAA